MRFLEGFNKLKWMPKQLIEKIVIPIMANISVHMIIIIRTAQTKTQFGTSAFFTNRVQKLKLNFKIFENEE